MNRAFMPEPSILLPDKAATVHALAHPEDWIEKQYPFGWMVKSVWLCAQMNEYERTVGYAYNVAVMRWIEQREGWEPADENGSPLARLIYSNQGFRRSDKLIAQGYAPLSEAMIDEAVETKHKIEVLGENILGGSVKTVCRPISQDGKRFVLLPKKRNKGFRPEGQPAKLVPA